eukprot:1157663-Pelagomonas_calceolata.AAC.3
MHPPHPDLTAAGFLVRVGIWSWGCVLELGCCWGARMLGLWWGWAGGPCENPQQVSGTHAKTLQGGCGIRRDEGLRARIAPQNVRVRQKRRYFPCIEGCVSSIYKHECAKHWQGTELGSASSAPFCSRTGAHPRDALGPLGRLLPLLAGA